MKILLIILKKPPAYLDTGNITTIGTKCAKNAL